MRTQERNFELELENCIENYGEKEIVTRFYAHEDLVTLLKEVRFLGACTADQAKRIDEALAKAKGDTQQ